MRLRDLFVLTLVLRITSPVFAQAEVAEVEVEVEAEAEAEANAAEPTPDEQAAIDRARELFLEGVDQFEAHDLDAAIASFSEAMAMHDAPTIRYNLASAHAEQGNHVVAYQHTIALQAREDLEPDLRRDVDRLERRMRRRVGRIDLRSTDFDEVRLDGASTEPGLLIVQPGTHVIEGFRNGTVAVRREVEVGPRERVTVDLAVVTVREVVEGPSRPTPIDRAPLRRGLGISAAIVAVGIVIVAIVATRGPDPVDGNLEPGTFRW